jgi:hypothetical protein
LCQHPPLRQTESKAAQLESPAAVPPHNTQRQEDRTVKNLLSCTFGRVCSDIPGTCIVLQMILVVALASVLGYVFVTQELLG